MFIPARTLYATHELKDAGPQTEESKQWMVREKLGENKKYGKPDLGEPVTVWHGGEAPALFDGHHRLAEGLKSDQELPVQHIDDTNWWTIGERSG